MTAIIRRDKAAGLGKDPPTKKDSCLGHVTTTPLALAAVLLALAGFRSVWELVNNFP
jgi:hypothetical protein